MTKRTVSIGEAATLLGISRDAVRKRIQRGTIEAKKGSNGRWMVTVDLDIVQDAGEDTGGDTSRPLVQAMQQEIDFLRKELERKDHILLALTQKIPLLEAPKEPQQEEGEALPFWKKIFNKNRKKY